MSDPLTKTEKPANFITDAFDAIVNIASPILKPIIDIGKTIVGGISTVAQDSGIAALISAISTITNGIDSLVNGVVGALGGIIDPIKNVVTSVKTLSDDITTKIVNPILKPISDTITNIEGLTKTVEKLVDQGIGGIIKIPQAISDALGGIEASWDRATKSLAVANALIASETMVPGIKDAVAPGLADIHGQLLQFNKNSGLNVDQTGRVAIPQNAGDAFNEAAFKEIADRVNNPQDIYDKIMAALINTIRYVVGASAELTEFLNRGIEQARVGNPQTPFDPSTAVALLMRGILNRPDAQEDAAKGGINEARFQALFEAAQYLPSTDEAIFWQLKGLITDNERDNILAKRGYNADASRAVVAAATVNLAPETLLEWLAREFITQSTFDSLLKAQGYDNDALANTLKAAILPEQVNTAINAAWNYAAASSGWFSETYGGQPPDNVIAAGRVARLAPEETIARWRSQWASMPVSTAINLFFRGEMTRAQVQVVVLQNGYPPSMTDLLIKAETPLVPSRTIPTLVAKGELTAAQGTDRLIAKGFSIEDAVLLVSAAVDAVGGGTAAPQTDASKITVAQVRTAFKDGVIDEATARALMAQQGLAPFDIDFYVAQDSYDVSVKAVTAEIDTLKAEVTLGVMTLDDATTQLFSLGLPEGQVAKALVSIQQAQRAAAKVPDLSLLKSMVKAGLIDQPTFLSAVQGLGYSAPWDQLITSLTFSPGGANAQPSTP